MANPSLEVRRSFPQIDLNYIRSNRRAFSQSSDTYAAQYLIKGRGPQVDLDLRPNLSLKNSPHFCIVQKQHQKKPVTEAEEARGPRCACGDSIMIENGIPMRVFSFGNGGCGTSLTATMSVTFNGPLHDHIPKRAKYAWTRTQHKQPQQQRH